MRGRLAIFGAMGLCLCGPALAHPHVFVDVAIAAHLDPQGRLTAIDITWTYDDFFSLMTLEDRQLDPDADGVLTPEELAALQGFDMQWQPGYAGDTHVTLSGEPLALSGPSDWTAALVEGRIISTHRRQLLHPQLPGAEPVMIQSYDPEYYVAYTIVDATLTGAGFPDACDAVIWAVDLTAADEMLNRAAQEYAASEDPNLPVPLIGAAYADDVRITCPPP